MHRPWVQALEPQKKKKFLFYLGKAKRIQKPGIVIHAYY
jgi:hypothetical protein